MLSLIVLSLLIVAGATRSPRPRPLQIYTAPTAPAGTHWKNRPNISRKGVVGRGRGVRILAGRPRATPYHRTVFYLPAGRRGAVHTFVQVRKHWKALNDSARRPQQRRADHEDDQKERQAGEPLPPHRRALLTSSADLHTEIFRGL